MHAYTDTYTYTYTYTYTEDIWIYIMCNKPYDASATRPVYLVALQSCEKQKLCTGNSRKRGRTDGQLGSWAANYNVALRGYNLGISTHCSGYLGSFMLCQPIEEFWQRVIYLTGQ